MFRAASTSSAIAPRLGFVDQQARKYILSCLAELNHGTLHLHEPGNTATFGKVPELAACMTIHRPRFFRRVVLGGTLSAAESYIEGDWDSDDLTALLRIFIRNRIVAERYDRGAARLARLLHRAVHRWRSNTRAGSRRNIAAHYDLGNDFYRLWLDETLAYSCGIFSSPDASLVSASTEKFDRVCRKLDLRASDELLEIGTGWGGLAIHAAKHYGCNVTTTTISRQQLELARERVVAAGLASRITLLPSDYRDLQGCFDKLVSIEMIEAVGSRYHDAYFQRCGELLKPDGTFVIQTIVMPDRGYEQYLQSVDFIQRYVFPGGCLPSIGAILKSVARTSDLRLVHVEDFAPHYAETLRRWRAAFASQLEAVRALGHSETFIRLWNYYLCYCEAAFAERAVGVVQMQFDKPDCQRDPLNIARLAVANSSTDSSARIPSLEQLSTA